MKHVEIHVHYLRQLVKDNVVKLIYCKTYNQIAIFMKPLFKSKFVILHGMLGLQATSIMGVCSKEVISHPRCLECSVDRGVLDPMSM